uniref:Uncharacterized protein n=1 Tax=Kalanchoe fedtschenkoi TaxID=63787 RepID=A0A7N0VL99_KALFE
MVLQGSGACGGDPSQARSGCGPPTTFPTRYRPFRPRSTRFSPAPRSWFQALTTPPSRRGSCVRFDATGRAQLTARQIPQRRRLGNFASRAVREVGALGLVK